MTTPPSPCGTFSEVVPTSRAFSLKMARISFSAVSSVSALWGDLADEEVAGADLGDAAMPRSSRLRSDSLERFDVAGDLLVAELRRAGVDLVLVDVDRGETSFLTRRLNDDRVLGSCSPRTA
jgi:hypothetical protein